LQEYAMSRYELRGTAGWDDCDDHVSTLGTDFRWELGYSPERITYYADLWDDAPMDDPDCPPTPELARPILAIGAMPVGVLTVEELEREMDVELPGELVAQLRQERERHLAGKLGEPAHLVRERWLTFRELAFRDHLTDMQRYLGQPGA
jgi:hypothetical protein